MLYRIAQEALTNVRKHADTLLGSRQFSTHTPARGQTVIILLEAAGQRFGLPIDVVRDVLTLRWAGRGGWRVRRAAPGLSCDGWVIDLGRQRAPLIEVGASPGLPPGRGCHGRTRTRSVVVVQCGERWLGLLVDRVGEVVEVPLTAIVPRSGPLASELPIRQDVQLADRTVGLLDADLLLPPAEALSFA